MLAFAFRYSANDCGKLKDTEILLKPKKIYVYAKSNETI